MVINVAAIADIYILLLSRCCCIYNVLLSGKYSKSDLQTCFLVKWHLMEIYMEQFMSAIQAFSKAKLGHPKVNRLILAAEALHLLSRTGIGPCFPNGLHLFLAEAL